MRRVGPCYHIGMTQDRVRPIPVGPQRRRSRPTHFEPRDAIRFAFRHYRIIVAFVIFFCTGAMLEHRYFPVFRARATIYVDRSDVALQSVSQRLQGINTMQIYGDSPSADLEKYIRYLQSYDFFLSVGKKVREAGLEEQVEGNILRPSSIKEAFKNKTKVNVDSRADPGGKSPRDLFFADGLQAWTAFSPIGADGISVQVSAPDKELSRTLADLIANLGLAWISKSELRQLDSAVKYLEGRIVDSEAKIGELEALLVDFKKKNRLMTLNGASGTLSRNPLEDDLRSSRVQFEENKFLIGKYKERLSRQQQAVADAMKDVPNAEANATVPYRTQVAQKLAEMETANQVLLARINSYQTQINESIRTGRFGLEQEAYEFQKKFELQYALFQDLMKEKFRIELNRIAVENRMRNITKAEYSEVQRTFSLSKKLTFALVLGLIISLAIAYLLDLLFPVINSRQDLAEMGFYVLGGIQDYGRLGRSKITNLFSRISGKPVKVFRFDNDSLSLSNLFQIRSKIIHQLQKAGKEHGVIAFVGASPGDGKTFTATNVAASMATLGRKTLLVDTDLRAQGCTKVFHLEGKPGLSEVALHPEMFGQVVQKNVLPRLDVLPSGTKTANPSELFASQNFRELTSKLSEIYDFVILDTPAILHVPETMEIEKSADFLIFVTSFNKTLVHDVLRSCETLLDFNGREHSKNLAILNRLDPRHDVLVLSPSSQYYYGYGMDKANY